MREFLNSRTFAVCIWVFVILLTMELCVGMAWARIVLGN